MFLEPQQMAITSPENPTPELQSEAGVLNYQAKASELTLPDLCIELSNVMAAKHNQMQVPLGLRNHLENQTIVTDLTDKAVVICFVHFGQPKVLEYCGGDLRKFNALVNEVDEEVAQQDMKPAQHGSIMLGILGERLKLDLLVESGEDGNLNMKTGAELQFEIQTITELTREERGYHLGHTLVSMESFMVPDLEGKFPLLAYPVTPEQHTVMDFFMAHILMLSQLGGMSINSALEDSLNIFAEMFDEIVADKDRLDLGIKFVEKLSRR